MGSHGKRLDSLERAERYLAREQILGTLGRLPDRELARIAVERDGAALEAAGVTDALLRSATGAPGDPEEMRRRLADLFAPLRQRAPQLKIFMDPDEGDAR